MIRPTLGSYPEFFCHPNRFSAARLAMSVRCSGVSEIVRALSPQAAPRGAAWGDGQSRHKAGEQRRVHALPNRVRGIAARYPKAGQHYT